MHFLALLHQGQLPSPASAVTPCAASRCWCIAGGGIQCLFCTSIQTMSSFHALSRTVVPSTWVGCPQALHQQIHCSLWIVKCAERVNKWSHVPDSVPCFAGAVSFEITLHQFHLTVSGVAMGPIWFCGLPPSQERRWQRDWWKRLQALRQIPVT